MDPDTKEVWNKLHGKKYADVFFPETRVKHKDYMHLKDFYRMMHDYMVEHEFCGTGDGDFPEIFYTHKWDQQKGEELHFWWRFTNTHRGSSYFQWWLNVDVNIFNMKQVEIMKNGNKYKAQFAEPEVKISGQIVVDPDGLWDKHWFLKSVNMVFWKRIWYPEFLKHKKDMVQEVYRFEEHIKTYFKLVTYSSEGEGESYYTTDEFD